MTFQAAAVNINNYVDEKWTGYITCKLNHLGCTSTQRAESSHHALKKGVSAVLPLEGAFRNVDEFINNFERKYHQLEIEEATRVDILLYEDSQLQKLFKKVSHRALSKVRFRALYALYNNVASLLIKKDAVLYIFDFEGDGSCGYRAVVGMMEKSENMFSRVKEKMLHAFEKYKNNYRENFWFQDLDHLKKNIKNSINWTTATRCSKYSGYRFFYTPECANVKTATYLPIDYTTDKTKQRSLKPLVLQNESNIHWISVKVGRKIQKQWPHVFYCLFVLPPCLEEFNAYWNKDKMFPDPVERNNRSLSGLSDDILLIEPDENDE
ncbi:hypothetical protein RMATCC62417_05927 [Rhizopus microsporus]|nr:hypothetical protein RMATCC62417_05927 [Rhizopus microsporus]